MKRVAFKVMLLLSVYTLCAHAQDSVSKVINQINFPYKKGYNMFFKGKQTLYEYGDHYKITGKPHENTTDYTLYYHITDEYINKWDTLVNFYVKETSLTDTVIMNSSPLYFNPDGMFCYYAGNHQDNYEKEFKKVLKKNKGDTIWHTISTPLFVGKTWEGLTYDFRKGIFTCLNIDSVIHTGIGDFNAFCVSQLSVLSDDKDSRTFNLFIEWYAQGVGKIANTTEMLLYVKANGNVLPMYREDAVLRKTWWDDAVK